MLNKQNKQVKKDFQPNNLFEYMVNQKDYLNAIDFLTNHSQQDIQLPLAWCQLGHAILAIDIEQVDQLARWLDITYLLRPTHLQRRTYYFIHSMQKQLDNHEYADYIRALTPVLVDVMRLITERTIIPQLNEFLIPVVKETEDGNQLYRGLQWNQVRIESSDNIIRQTFAKYYGDSFNYNHYVSSSHLAKIIEEFGQDEMIKSEIKQMRHVEKYLRNIVAHEVIHVDADFVFQRVHMSMDEIHDLLLKLTDTAGLRDQQQRSIMITINYTLKKWANQKIRRNRDNEKVID